MFGTITLYHKDTKAFFATLIVREENEVKLCRCYEPATLTKDQFLENIFKDMCDAGVTSYECLDVEVKRWNNYILANRN